MRGNSPVRFRGEETRATESPYPTSAGYLACPARRRDLRLASKFGPKWPPMVTCCKSRWPIYRRFRRMIGLFRRPPFGGVLVGPVHRARACGQGGNDLLGGLEALGGVFFEAAQNDPLEIRRNSRAPPAWGNCRGIQVSRQ